MMNRVRVVAVVAAGLAVAVAAGTMLQQTAGQPAVAAQGQAMPSLAGQVETGTRVRAAGLAPTVSAEGVSPGPAAELAALTQTLPDPSPESIAAPSFSAAASTEIVAADQGSEPLVDTLMAEIDACARWLVVTADPGAMLDVSLYAPCDSETRVTLTHDGVAFDALIDAGGMLSATVPALADEALVTVAFADGTQAEDTAMVADLVLHERVAVHWQGPAVVGLAAYEFGADFGEEGHVTADRSDAMASATRGAVHLLGDAGLEAPRLAQIYTFPTGLAAELEQVELELEVAVTDLSCAQDLALALAHRLGAPVETRRITLTLPDCQDTGGFLVLKNLLPEQIIALN